MSEDLQQLLARKQQLLARSANLRERLMAQTAEFSPVLSVVDRVSGGIATLRQHPEWVVGALAFVAVARPRFVWRWARRGLVGWRTWSSLRDLLASAVSDQRNGLRHSRSRR